MWAENIELLIRLTETYPNSNVYQLALSNCCKHASTIIRELHKNEYYLPIPSIEWFLDNKTLGLIAKCQMMVMSYY